eukprot:CAMPEP_0197545070 /NCGR_PEP_ID=MMETSP1320-20131121/265_1 /TAXON_ID=91990 /ORGANISM="Bolidomonas sp., Strain RCC2347" /LENGTH=138 /DNA_ID=CAMNT_0043104547 /DNA_START=682 /DNA_END=1098 /DNA_ORIENTATION=-
MKDTSALLYVIGLGIFEYASLTRDTHASRPVGSYAYFRTLNGAGEEAGEAAEDGSVQVEVRDDETTTSPAWSVGPPRAMQHFLLTSSSPRLRVLGNLPDSPSSSSSERPSPFSFFLPLSSRYLRATLVGFDDAEILPR